MPLGIRGGATVTVGLCVLALLIGGCAGSTTGAPAASSTARASPAAAGATAAQAPGGGAAVATESPLAPETNPAGDIPDNQVFVTYASTGGGYRLEVPEGWARTETGSDVRFVSKLDGVQVGLISTATAPTAASAQTSQVVELQRAGRAVKVNQVQDVRLPAGPAVLVDYSSNSEPDPVTGKQVRLENNAYLFYRNGALATLTLWAPQGADNVDQWLQMAQSFQWN